MRMEEREKEVAKDARKDCPSDGNGDELIKGKEITAYPSLQRRPTFWKDGIDPSIVPNPNDPCE